MRKELEKIENIRDTFSGTFERFGVKTNYHGFFEKTVLLKNIKNKDGQIVTDHAWFNYLKNFKKLNNLKQGDLVFFNARIKKYKKGLYGMRENDFRFSHATKFSKK